MTFFRFPTVVVSSIFKSSIFIGSIGEKFEGRIYLLGAKQLDILVSLSTVGLVLLLIIRVYLSGERTFSTQVFVTGLTCSCDEVTCVVVGRSDGLIIVDLSVVSVVFVILLVDVVVFGVIAV